MNWYNRAHRAGGAVSDGGARCAGLRANLFSGVGQHDRDAGPRLSYRARAVGRDRRGVSSHAVWSAPDGRACHAASGGEGACWAFIGVWYRFILFGRYPYAEQWRPLLVVAHLRRAAAGELRPAPVGLADRGAVGRGAGGESSCLMLGGVARARAMSPTELWSGLPLTLILAVVGLGRGISAGGRCWRSGGARACRRCARLSVAYIELVRGVPLITVLFMASVMLPLFLPEGTTIDKLLRAQVGFILFYAAYLAEVVRGGLQAIPRGPVRGGRRAGPGLLAQDAARHPAAGAQDRDPAARQHLHRRLQGHDARHHHRPVRSDLDRVQRDHRSRTGAASMSRPMASSRVLYFVFCFFMSRYSQALERSLARGRA